MSYDNRRYRVVGGFLEKAFHGLDRDGWVRSKTDAWAAFNTPAAPEPAAAPPVEIVTGIVETPDQPAEDEDAPSTVLQEFTGPKKRGPKPLPRDDAGNIIRDDA
jgi:hypothetical protein